MKIGVPGASFYYEYQDAIESVAENLGVELEVLRDSSAEILRLGKEGLADESCISTKAICGRTKALLNTCDYVIIPAISRTEFGDTLCPKLCGIRQLLGSEKDNGKLIIADLPDLRNVEATRRKIIWALKKTGLPGRDIKKAVKRAFSKEIAGLAWTAGGRQEDSGKNYAAKVLLTGHSYNVNDRYLNRDIVTRLHRLNIGVTTGTHISREQMLAALKKRNPRRLPYWRMMTEILGRGYALNDSREIDGIIYLSAFSCGIDAFAIALLEREVHPLPVMTVKLDEQYGDAGFITRLEAFADLLKGAR